MPKEEIIVPPPDRPKKPLASFRRLENLAKPKEYIEFEDNTWKFTRAMKDFRPTDRILKIAQPKDYPDDIHYREIPFKIAKATLKHKASKRTLELSTPQEKKYAVSDLKENPFTISPNALKAKASARTKELAEPKEYEEPKERPLGFVSPAALKAKASPRTIELAQPKKRS